MIWILYRKCPARARPPAPSRRALFFDFGILVFGNGHRGRVRAGGRRRKRPERREVRGGGGLVRGLLWGLSNRGVGVFVDPREGCKATCHGCKTLPYGNDAPRRGCEAPFFRRAALRHGHQAAAE